MRPLRVEGIDCVWRASYAEYRIMPSMQLNMLVSKVTAAEDSA